MPATNLTHGLTPTLTCNEKKKNIHYFEMKAISQPRGAHMCPRSFPARSFSFHCGAAIKTRRPRPTVDGTPSTTVAPRPWPSDAPARYNTFMWRTTPDYILNSAQCPAAAPLSG